jgi:transcriptional regulator with XRE-family HTH domain
MEVQMLHSKLRKRIDALNITQLEAASRCGISESYLSDLLLQKRGKRIGLETVRKIEQGLGVRFFSNSNPQRRNKP